MARTPPDLRLHAEALEPSDDLVERLAAAARQSRPTRARRRAPGIVAGGSVVALVAGATWATGAVTTPDGDRDGAPGAPTSRSGPVVPDPTVDAADDPAVDAVDGVQPTGGRTTAPTGSATADAATDRGARGPGAPDASAAPSAGTTGRTDGPGTSSPGTGSGPRPTTGSGVTPATPATPAEPGRGGGRAQPAQPAEPARPAQGDRGRSDAADRGRSDDAAGPGRAHDRQDGSSDQ